MNTVTSYQNIFEVFIDHLYILNSENLKSFGCFSRVNKNFVSKKEERLKIEVGNGEKNNFLKYIVFDFLIYLKV